MAGGFSQTFGLWHITSHWAFVLAQLYFLTTLGLVTLKRMHPLTRKNIGFLFNHAGLWITIASAVMGAGDLKRLSMQITENQPFVNTAYSYGKQSVAYQLPFAIKLIDFEIEQYAPKIALMHKPTGKLIYEAGKELPELKTGLTVEMLDWKIQVIEYQELAFTNGGRCVVSTERGASPAAFVKVTNKLNSSTTQSWLNCGSFINTRLDLDIDSALALVMLEPEPKKYSSKIEYITKTDEKKSVVLEVNQPITIEGWKVYQTGFDEQQGRWSQTSGLELVHDPWLPVVYLGVFLMFAGAVYLFGIGKEIGLE